MRWGRAHAQSGARCARAQREQSQRRTQLFCIHVTRSHSSMLAASALPFCRSATHPAYVSTGHVIAGV
eukprot:2519328-Rhodomonas_salina.2